MKKFALFIILILTIFPLFYQTARAESFPSQVRVIYNSADAYSTTDILSFSNKEESDAKVVKTFHLHDVIDVFGEEGDFYIIKIKEQNCFIFKEMVIDNNNKSPTKLLDTNAITVRLSALYSKKDNEYILQEKQLKMNTKIKVLNGYDKQTKFTQISFQENGQVLTYFIKTKDIKVEGINYTVIITILGIISALSITLILLKIIKPKPIVK